ncbi:MAG: hypothetical protein IPI46_10530 [Bacteroidetes bacterium]|nr:hypothetical protein [Bacteroidota bacterium]
MAVERLKYNHEGGDLMIEIVFKGLIAASYKYTLWEKDSNEIAFQKSGNNINREDDIFTLQAPLSKHAGRLIDVHASIKGLYEQGTEGTYEFVVIIKQDSNVLMQNVQPANQQTIGEQMITHQFYVLLV